MTDQTMIQPDSFDLSLVERLEQLQTEVRLQAEARGGDTRRSAMLESLGALLDQPIRAAQHLGKLPRRDSHPLA